MQIDPLTQTKLIKEATPQDPTWSGFFTHFTAPLSEKNRSLIQNHFLFFISQELNKIFKKSLQKIKQNNRREL